MGDFLNWILDALGLRESQVLGGENEWGGDADPHG